MGKSLLAKRPLFSYPVTLELQLVLHLNSTDRVREREKDFEHLFSIWNLSKRKSVAAPGTD